MKAFVGTLLTLPPGTAAAPPLALQGLVTSGFYFPTTTSIGMTLNGVEVVRQHSTALAFVAAGIDIGDSGGSRPNAVHVTTTVEARGYVSRVHAMTIADNTVGASVNTETITPTTQGYWEITCSDADGCTLIFGETSVPRGLAIEIVNVGTNTVNVSDTAGVSETAGAFAMGQWDVIGLRYAGTTWAERFRSNN